MAFDGFPTGAFRFFTQLARHNNREWFLAHRDSYDANCRAPLQALAADLEFRFGKGKLSRINRDLRFARGRPPYKTFLAIVVAGRYIALDANGVWVGAGLYMPEPKVLRRLREAIAHDESGRQLTTIIATLRRKGHEVDSHERLAATPRGFSPDHPRLALLQMKDLYAGKQFGREKWLSTPAARARIERALADVGDLVTWLRLNVTGTG